MARRNRGSGAAQVLDLVSRLPWWVGVVLAAVSYVLLHKLATPAVPMAPLQPGQMAAPIVGVMVSSLALAGQYVLPPLCLLGAAMSAWRRRRGKELLKTTTQVGSPQVLNGMTWREFEQLVGEAFRLKGYRVMENGGGAPDGGVDLVLNKGQEIYLVQCKQWKAFKVGVDVVRELYGVMAARGAAGGFVVTSGQFTGDAKAFAEGRNITLMDGGQLQSMLQSVQKGAHQAPHKPTPASIAQKPMSEPTCPKCNAQMVQRMAKQGANAGQAFWGCSRYPGCRGILRAG